jgi:hypothetical protein
MNRLSSVSKKSGAVQVLQGDSGRKEEEHFARRGTLRRVLKGTKGTLLLGAFYLDW